MAATIRKHLRDFIAVAGLCAIALFTVYVLLQQQRLRIPVLEEKPFELKAEFETAQAVTPGQGQTVVVAGVKIGEISKVELKDGRAVVTMDVERKFLPIYRNATALIRPRTGLQDVFIELDPGSRSAGDFRDGDTIPVSNTAPEVNLDQILDALDKDTQAYLRILIVGAGQGLKGRAKDLGKLLNGLGPINHELARLNSQVATRRHNLARLIHNLNVVTGAVGRLLQLGAGRDREGGHKRAAGGRAAAGHFEHRPRHPRQDGALRATARPDLQQPAALRAQPRSPKCLRQTGLGDEAGREEPDPALRQRGAGAGEEPAPRRKAACQGNPQAHRHRHRDQPAGQHGRL
jgi:virulence factor Mce-like protein